eukprot:TRINITY_DN30942_c0_g1_i1.p5 TRINITY_DN30942_c0_g1~~TRINITY_DN30942_c0_g1_i1.p5  ORF type:complete len:214 (+),score=-9.68 TRINITY_DN30942_c0_g1_i1:738-1379(+)
MRKRMRCSGRVFCLVNGAAYDDAIDDCSDGCCIASLRPHPRGENLAGSHDLPEFPCPLGPGGGCNDTVCPAFHGKAGDLFRGSPVEELGCSRVAHLGHDKTGSPVINGDVHAGLDRVPAGEPVADYRGKAGIKDLLRDKPVGVGNIGHLEIGDEREIEILQFANNGKPGGEDERVPEFYGVHVGSTGPCDREGCFLLRCIQCKDQFSHGAAAP